MSDNKNNAKAGQANSGEASKQNRWVGRSQVGSLVGLGAEVATNMAIDGASFLAGQAITMCKKKLATPKPTPAIDLTKPAIDSRKADRPDPQVKAKSNSGYQDDVALAATEVGIDIGVNVLGSLLSHLVHIL